MVKASKLTVANPSVANLTVSKLTVSKLTVALDIFELLAGRAEGLSLAAIAGAVGGSEADAAMVLHTLELRGYVLRDAASGLYFFSMMAFELAHRHDPVRGLREAALPPMRALAAEIEQSCNLGVLKAGSIVIIAQVESPTGFGFRVRVGADFVVERTPTGAVLAAFGGAPGSLPSANSAATAADDEAWLVRVQRVRERGFERSADGLHPGIIDIVFPVFSAAGTAIAALTVPYVSTSYSTASAQTVEKRTAEAARRISLALGAEPLVISNFHS
jgi:DNA-binding IclR family transcriptional regulator